MWVKKKIILQEKEKNKDYEGGKEDDKIVR